MRVQRGDQATRGVAVEQQPLHTLVRLQQPDGSRDVVEVLVDVGSEVRQLPLAQRAPVAAQVERVEPHAQGLVERGEMRLEEVVAEPVHVQHRRPTADGRGSTPHHDGVDGAAPEGHGQRRVLEVGEHVRSPGRSSHRVSSFDVCTRSVPHVAIVISCRRRYISRSESRSVASPRCCAPTSTATPSRPSICATSVATPTSR